MPRPLATDFALTTLASGITASSPSLTVAAGTGSLFPSPSGYSQPNGTFVIAIDSELICCSARTSDTFTVWSDSSGNTGRGYGGTTAAIHSAGVNVTLALPANYLQQIWSVLPDTFDPDVPAWARGSFSNGVWKYPTTGGTPGTYDEEFDGPYKGWDTPWSFSPRPLSLVAPDGSTGNNSGATAYWGTSAKSCLSFIRNANNADVWFAYRSFTPGTGSWTVQAKITDTARMIGLNDNLTPNVMFGLFVSNQANPTTNVNSGTSVRLDHELSGNNTIALTATGAPVTGSVSLWRAGHAVSNSYTTDRWALDCGEQYYQIDYDGGSTYHFSVGNGGTFRQFGYSVITGGFTPATVGFRWYIAPSVQAGSVDTKHTTYIDWLRTA